MLSPVSRALILLLLLSSLKVSAQNYYVTIPDTVIGSRSLRYSIDNCFPAEFHSCATGDVYTDMAVDVNRNTWYVDDGGNLYKGNLDDTSVCQFMGSFPASDGYINGLVVDVSGILYAAGPGSGSPAQLYKYDNGAFSAIGFFPDDIEPEADMFFFDHQLFMTAYNDNTGSDCLIEVSLANPSQSSCYMTLPGVAYAAICVTENGIEKPFVITTDGNTTSWLVALNIPDHAVEDTVCTYPYIVFGAGSMDGISDTTGIGTYIGDSTSDCNVYLPNAFTPNGDGKNDLYKPLFTGTYDLHVFLVMNRWGQVVFSAHGTTSGWDGRFKGVRQDAGTYFYYSRSQCTNGKTIEKKGDLTLVR